MPIEGLTNAPRRLPRIDKIAIGMKVKKCAKCGTKWELPHKCQFPAKEPCPKCKSTDGTVYPESVDYFVVPPEVQKVYGDKPTSLAIMFPVEDESIFAAQWYEKWGNGVKYCQGDGINADMSLDVNTGTMADGKSEKIERKIMSCDGRECPYYGTGKGKGCTEVMHLQFLLPDVPGLGVWQIDTGSIYGIKNINSFLTLLRSVAGRVAGVPLELFVEIQEIPFEGKKKKVPILNLRSHSKLAELVKGDRFLLKAGPDVSMPAPDDQQPDMVAPPPEPPVAPPDTTERKQRKTRSDKGTTKDAPPAAPPQGKETELFSPEDEAAHAKEIEARAKEAADAARDASAKQHAEVHEITPGVGEFKTLGEFFSRCHRDFLYMRSDVLTILGYTDTMEISDMGADYLKVKKHWEANHGK